MGVREPTANGYRMLRMKYIRRRGIINNDRFSKITTNLRKVLQKSVQRIRPITSKKQTNFDIISLVIVTTISEESMVDDMMDVQLI